MLEPVRLGVHLVETEAERLGEIELEETVVPDHLQRDSFAGGRQLGAAVALVLHEAERGQALDHRGRRGRPDAYPVGDRGRGRPTPFEAELVDLAQVVLHRVREVPDHQPQSNSEIRLV